MTEVAHIAIKVDDLDAATKFYEEVFGFQQLSTDRVRDHISRHLTDGRLDIALIRYDIETSSAESQAAGQGPAIHHIGFAVDDVEQCIDDMKKRGCQIISSPGVLPVKFRAPGGTVAEIAPSTHFRNPK